MKFTSRQIALIGVLGAITIALGFMPMIGFIRLPMCSATTMHIPTILAGVMEGPVIGGLVGAIFGAFSFYQATTAINPAEKMIFSNPLIAFFPRILIGVVAHYVAAGLKGKNGQTIFTCITGLVLGYTGYLCFPEASVAVKVGFALLLAAVSVVAVLYGQRHFQAGPALASIAGSLTNTVGVLGLCVAFGYLPHQLAGLIAVTNGIPEAVVAMVLVSLIYKGAVKGFKDVGY